MKNQVDFIKIDGGSLGVINLNNMVPVPDDALLKVSMNNHEGDSKAVIASKALLRKQLTWCNKTINKDMLLNRSAKLRSIIVTGSAPAHIKARCCDFEALERFYMEYVALGDTH